MANYLKVKEGESVKYFNLDQITTLAFKNDRAFLWGTDGGSAPVSRDYQILDEHDFMLELAMLSTHYRDGEDEA
jgi:hypothetical protein